METQPTRLAYTVEEVATMLGVSVATIYRAVDAGTLPHKRIGPAKRGRILIPAAALENWLKHPNKPRRAAFEEKVVQIVAGVRRRRG